MGNRRAPRAEHDQLGLEYRSGWKDADTDFDGRRNLRQAGRARPRPRTLCGSGIEGEGADRSWMLVPQRNVGEESSPPVQGIAGVAGFRVGGWNEGRRVEAGLLGTIAPPRQEGWPRHQADIAKPPLDGADGVVVQLQQFF